MNYIRIKGSGLIFNDKAKEQCRSCKRYGKKATCPPYTYLLGSNKILNYKNGILCYEEFKINNKQEWRKLSKDSSLKMHAVLLKKRDELIKKGHYYTIAYGAGSCKLCLKCSFPCRYPEKSLIPIEAMGLDIVRMMKKYANIKLVFPVKNFFYRVGLILYD